ncbi:MAG: spore coat associated protein CotJA [Clostridia bacterium]|nr:spore coat associated protein CotJA [Clostridia bacterium]
MSDIKLNVPNASLAMSYVPTQDFQNLYDYEKGFSRGTVFSELDLPFYGDQNPKLYCPTSNVPTDESDMSKPASGIPSFGRRAPRESNDGGYRGYMQSRHYFGGGGR